MKNVFEKPVTEELINRINQLNAETIPEWGEMTVDQMLAHCNITYEMAYTDKHPKPNAIMKFILKLAVKKTVVGEKPYPKNGQTAPQFLIKEAKDFNAEKTRLVDYLNKTQELGASHFDQKESHSFGKLNVAEWNNMFYKHLDHHLRQFGV